MCMENRQELRNQLEKCKERMREVQKEQEELHGLQKQTVASTWCVVLGETEDSEPTIGAQSSGIKVQETGTSIGRLVALQAQG
jgi:hypothetical protein